MASLDHGRRSVGAAVAVGRAPLHRLDPDGGRSPAAASMQTAAETSPRPGLLPALIFPLLAPLLLAALVVAMIVVVLGELDAIDRTDRAVATVHRIHAVVLDADRGLRGFLLGGADDMLEPYRRAAAALDTQFPILTALLGDEHQQLARAETLRQRIAEWQRLADRQIAERRMAGSMPRDAVSGPAHQQMDAMDALRADIDALVAAADTERHARETWTDAAIVGVIAITVLSALLLGLALAYGARRRVVALAARDAQARTALHAGDGELRLAFEHGAGATAYIDPITHRFLRVNPAFSAATGYAAAELATMRFLDLTHPEDRESELACLQRLGGRELAQYEKRGVRKDGSVRWMRVEASLVPAADDHPARIAASLSDITDKKRAAEALRESESRFRQLLERLPQLVWTARASGECDYLSPQWLAYTGRPESQQLGNGWLDSVHPHDRDGVAALWHQTVSGAGSMTVAYRLRRHDESYRWFEMCVTAVPNGAARPGTWIASSHDVEEHKRGEAEARGRAAALEGRIEERTVQGEDASRELEAFTYSVSHDLRSPLRRVDGFAELLGKALADGRADKVQHYLGRISSEAQRAGRLIDDLLEFSRAGRAALRVQPVDAGRLIADVRAELGEHEGRTVVWDVETLPVVSADPAMLRIVFANLLSNAVKYSAPRAAARIRVAGGRGDGETIFVVADNGVGFDMRYAGQLFGVFQRLHLAEEFEGSGIGLALVQRIVSRHGGRVWVEAEEGKGATFYVALPDPPEAARHA